MTRRTFSTIQAARGIAALGVVFFHAGEFVGLDPRFWHHASLARQLSFGALGVQFFFFLSGVVMLLAHWEDQGRPQALPSYLWKRLRRIFPLYWLVLAAVVLAYCASVANHFHFEPRPWTLISSILLVHVYTRNTILHVAWTLYHEILFYLIFGLILLNRRFGYLAMAAWMAASCVALCGYFPNNWPREYITPLHLLFGMGMCATWVLHRFHRLPARILLCTSLPPILYILHWCSVNGAPILAMPIGVVTGLACIPLMLGVMELERRGDLLVPGSLNKLGDASYAIYLIHFPLLSLIFRLLYPMSRYVHLAVSCWLVVGVSLAVTSGVLLHVLVERPLLAWLRTPSMRSGPRLQARLD